MNNEDRIYTLRRCFRDFDKGSKGFLDEEDLELAMLALFGVTPTAFQVKQVLSADVNSDGVSETTFINLMGEKLRHVDADDMLRQTFRAFDAAGKGYLTLQDTLQAFRYVNPSVSAQTVHDCFQYGDADCDGRIGFQEFCRLMRGSVFVSSWR